MTNSNKDKNSKSSYIFTRETVGMTLMLFSAIVFIMLLTGKAVFAGLGKGVCTFMYGTFGYGSYFVVALVAYFGEWLVFEKKIKVRFKPTLFISLTIVCFFFLFHAVTSRDFGLENYGSYISQCYMNAAKGYAGYTFGGVISAIFVYPVAKLTTFIGAYVLFSVLTVLFAYLSYVVLSKRKKRVSEKSADDGNNVESISVEQPVDEQAQYTENVYAANNALTNNAEANSAYVQPQPVVQTRYQENAEKTDSDPYSAANLGRKILFEKGEFDAESYRRNMIFNESSYFNHPVRNDADYLSSFSSGKKKNSVPEKSYTDSYQEEILNSPVSSAPVNYVYGDKPVDELEGYKTVESYPLQEDVGSITSQNYNKDYQTNEVSADEGAEFDSGLTEYRETVDSSENESEKLSYELSQNDSELSLPPHEEERGIEKSVNMFDIFGANGVTGSENIIEPDTSRLTARREERRSNADLFDTDDDEDIADLRTERKAPEPLSGIESRNRFVSSSDRTSPVSEPLRRGQEKERENNNLPRVPESPVAQAEPKQEKTKHVWKKYIRPTLDLLDDYPENNNVNTGEIEDNKRTIIETLSRFKIDCEIANVTIGPAITRYDVIIEDKTKIKQSLNYKEAIAMALMKDNVNAYLNYSKGALSIEIPNNARAIVGLKSMLVSQKFINCKPSSITFALGRNVEGQVVCPDITKMPHLLVAGTTGSGKSICLSSLIISLLYKYGPEELRFILVDPKQVEFISYDKLPHLMINEIIYDVDKAIKALNWAIKEMERRYGLFKDMTEHGVATKNLDEYNNHLPEGEEKLPKIVIILDEFGDLMLQAKKDIEGRIIKLVQKARACGIHLILATQRPSVDCITGLIKSNLPTRIGFKVNSFDDSRTIFDIGGAEKLLGMGDMYFRSAESPDLARIQGCFVDSHEVQKVTDFIKANNETYFDTEVSDFINKVEVEENNSPIGGGDESSAEGDTKIDDTFIKALKYCVTSNQASVSMIQRRFPVGYIKACKIIDWMENMNYITQSEGSKPRKVLLSKEEFINTYGEIDD